VDDPRPHQGGDVGGADRSGTHLHHVAADELDAGSFDLIVEVVCSTEEELLSVINDEIRSIDGVRETETFMHLRTEKNVFAWGRRLTDQ
jgi:DNA-binding Lrp family transcriptional regulator